MINKNLISLDFIRIIHCEIKRNQVIDAKNYLMTLNVIGISRLGIGWSMVTLHKIVELLNIRKNKVLLIAKTALPESQFLAFKKLFLDEFGMRGLESELAKVISDVRQDNNGMDRNGQEDIKHERRCHHD